MGDRLFAAAAGGLLPGVCRRSLPHGRALRLASRRSDRGADPLAASDDPESVVAPKKSTVS